MSLRRGAAVLTAISIALWCPTVFLEAGPPSKAPDPRSMGPLPVGVTTTVFVDERRTDSFTKSPRTLVTEIWYPADDDARGKPKNRYSDFIPGGVTPDIDRALMRSYSLTAVMIDKLYWNEAVRDAGVRVGRYPLVIFSHGNGGTRHQNTFWCDYLASHGYIVVSPDHTGNARITIIGGKVIPYQPGERSQSAVDRPIDMRFLLERMIAWDKGADARFAGRIDTDCVCAAGMSFGSMTAIKVADQDPRFKAVVAMAGVYATHTNLTVPTLRMLGAEDTTLGPGGNARIRDHHERHAGPSLLLELPNGGHYSFTDIFKVAKQFGNGVGAGRRRATGQPFEHTPMELTYSIINSYSVAFLGYYLKGEKDYMEFLRKNQWPDDLVLKTKNL